jgi:hypothetical protein
MNSLMVNYLPLVAFTILLILFFPTSSFATLEPKLQVDESYINPILEVGGYAIGIANVGNATAVNVKFTLFEVNNMFNYTAESELESTIEPTERITTKYFLHPTKIGPSELYYILEYEDEQGNKFSHDIKENPIKLNVVSLAPSVKNLVGLTQNQTILFGMGGAVLVASMVLYVQGQNKKEKNNKV